MNNNTQNTLARINEIINKSSSGVILLPPNPTVDAIASATSLYLGLVKTGKNVSLASSSKPQSELPGADKIQTQMATGGDSLMISFPYSDGAIDKVDYNIQGDSFNLIVTPRAGYNKLDTSAVNYSYTGGSIDFIITIDTPTLSNLGEIYSDNQPNFTGHDIINIDRHLTNAFFGTVNLVNKTVSSVSELVLSVLQELKIEIDRDMATALYAGISASTNNFTSYSVNADTFEHIAALLRLGAVKKIIKKPASPVSGNSVRVMNTNPKMSYAPTVESQPVTPIQNVEKEKMLRGKKSENGNPSDWLKPKIFKNGGLI